MKNLDRRVAAAVRHFWRTRTRQGRAQGGTTGRRDHGNRVAATGGKQLDGFNNLFAKLLQEAGIPDASIFRTGKKEVTLPGFFRPSKQWDVVVVTNESLLALIECKALCGPSFGNNYNNRIEEAIGNAHDLWTAYREGAFRNSPKPFLAYLLLLEEDDASTRPVKVYEKHFPVFPEFRGASYAKRCEESLRRLLRERCYDAGSLILSSRRNGSRGAYKEPARDLSFTRLAKLLCNHAGATYRSL